jgi:hypothetical protein
MPENESGHVGSRSAFTNVYLRKGLGNLAKDQATGHFIPGIGKFRSAGMAYNKCLDLTDVLQAYFQDTTAYDGSYIDPTDAKKAIKYVISKKFRKSVRQGVKGTIVLGAAVAGAATGATVGSVIPGAGTVAGGVAGCVALSTAANTLAVVGDRMARGLKGMYKMAKGTRREHRDQAATALYVCWGARADTTYGAAAEQALEIILGDEYEKVMAKGPQDAMTRIAMRIKS